MQYQPSLQEEDEHLNSPSPPRLGTVLQAWTALSATPRTLLETTKITSTHLEWDSLDEKQRSSMQTTNTVLLGLCSVHSRCLKQVFWSSISAQPAKGVQGQQRESCTAAPQKTCSGRDIWSSKSDTWANSQYQNRSSSAVKLLAIYFMQYKFFNKITCTENKRSLWSPVLLYGLWWTLCFVWKLGSSIIRQQTGWAHTYPEQSCLRVCAGSWVAPGQWEHSWWKLQPCWVLNKFWFLAKHRVTWSLPTPGA